MENRIGVSYFGHADTPVANHLIWKVLFSQITDRFQISCVCQLTLFSIGYLLCRIHLASHGATFQACLINLKQFFFDRKTVRCLSKSLFRPENSFADVKIVIDQWKLLKSSKQPLPIIQAWNVRVLLQRTLLEMKWAFQEYNSSKCKPNFWFFKKTF